MSTPHKNNWAAKAKRTLSCLLPVDKRRKGHCVNCGACCKLPTPCLFLAYRGNGESYCKVHKIKPPNCRKYPQKEHHHVTKDTCGYWFE
jgi:Fe-S-cluster containining protein